MSVYEMITLKMAGIPKQNVKTTSITNLPKTGIIHR